MKELTLEELQNSKFGRLKVLGFPDKQEKRSKAVNVQCECGKVFIALLGNIRSGHTKSCGCLNIDSTRRRSVTHGLSRHTLYSVLATMKARCFNRNNEKYADYGGRGITICREWLDDFQEFYDFAIKNGWKEGLQIDRKNNDGDYSPDNCQFITGIQNSNNKRLIRKDNKTGFRGVYQKGRRFVASLSFKGIIRKDYHSFKTAIEAANFRDNKCVEMGIKTTMNFPEKYLS